jgi:hypothetical protein
MANPFPFQGASEVILIRRWQGRNRWASRSASREFRVAKARFGILAKFFAAEICTTSAPPERKTRPRRGKIFV